MLINEHIVLFDGFCNLCGGLVHFISKRDTKSKFLFLPLQSTGGQSILKELELPVDEFDSVVYKNGEKYFLKSSAILHIWKELGGIWKLFYIFIFIPASIRDPVYDIIARTRHKLFGRQDTCLY